VSSWFLEARYGVFVHYLPEGPGWEDEIDSFDVAGFGAQMEQAGAGYVFLTLGQNSGHYCAPNTAYEGHVGCVPHAPCSRRDLPLELADALAQRGIRLMLYLPSRAPQRDARAMAGLSDVNEQMPAPQAFTRKWSEVIREWSLRYGARISGWWFDAAYNTRGWDDRTQPHHWGTWAAACRAGNPESLLAFNPGVTPWEKAFSVLCPEQDYTAGEQNEWTATPSAFPAPAGVHWQILGFLGSTWGQADGPRLPDCEMIDFVRRATAEGGVVTMDVHLSAKGQVYPPHLAQLAAVRQAIWGR
jgi:hypothetical protein